MTTLVCTSHARWIVLGALAAWSVGLAGAPAWALGPGAPPQIVSQSVFVTNEPQRFAGSPQLIAQLTVEIPGGNVPLDVQSVTVKVPGIASPFNMPLKRLDLFPLREYFLNLTQAGVGSFPTGTYTFTVTDTSAGVTMANDMLTSATPLPALTSVSIPGTTPVSNETGFPPSLTYPATVALNLSSLPTPTVNWSAVTGAATYRLVVQVGGLDQDDAEIFARMTTNTSLTIPAGVMVPGRRYRVKLSAFDNANGLPDANALARNEIEVLTLGPTIFLTFAQGTYTAGQTLNVTARIYNTGPPVTVNAQAWLGTPFGLVVPILSMAGLTIPNSTANPSGPNDFYNGPLGFSYTFTGTEPSGFYVVGFRFTDPTTGETVALTSRSFAK